MIQKPKLLFVNKLWDNFFSGRQIIKVFSMYNRNIIYSIQFIYIKLIINIRYLIININM